jgi:hypothetical protein
MPFSVKSLLDNLTYVPSSKTGTSKSNNATFPSNESESPIVSATPMFPRVRRISNLPDYASRNDESLMTKKEVHDDAAKRQVSEAPFNGIDVDVFKAPAKVESQALHVRERVKHERAILEALFKAPAKVESQPIHKPQVRKSSFLDTSSRSLDAPEKRVSFAQHSEVKVYEVNRSHRKSYTSEDERWFKAEAYIDAIRVRDAITSHPDVNVKNPIKRLIELNLLSAEELVGLEQKISDLSGRKRAVEMRAHTVFLLEVQDAMGKKNQEVDAKQLSAAASISSSKSTRKARARAALAA